MSPFPAVVSAGPRHPGKNGHVPSLFQDVAGGGLSGYNPVLVTTRSNS
jgi:hypothetical protein